MPTCPNGHDVPAGQRFCGRCGEALPRDAAPTAPASVAAPVTKRGMSRGNKILAVACVAVLASLAALFVLHPPKKHESPPEWTPAQQDACQTEADRGQDAGTVGLDHQSYVDAVADCLVRVTGH